MSENRVEKVLQEYQNSTVSRLLAGLYSRIPGVPTYDPNWTTIEPFVRGLSPSATDAQVANAREIAQTDPAVGDILRVGGLLDTADKGIAVASGLLAAWKMFQGKGAATALDMDSAQAKDAMLKAVGVAILTYKAFPGPLQQKAAMLQESPAGKSLLLYYGTVEVALPFADNVAQFGAEKIIGMINSGAPANAGPLAAVAGGQAAEMLSGVTAQLAGATALASQYLGPIKEQLGSMAPTLGTAADTATGAIATAADMLNVYTILSARLAAEYAARKALTA